MISKRLKTMVNSHAIYCGSLFFIFFFAGLKMAFGQCPTTVPTVSDTCVIGAQSLDLTASGVGSNYAWYDASTGGNLIGNTNMLSTSVLNTTTTFYVAAQEENYALDFDGSNDRVAIQNYSYSASGLTELTVEAWVKTTSTSAQIVASFDRSEYWRLGVGSTGATAGRVSWNVRTNASFLDMGGATAVNDGNWHHIAGTYNNGVASIYVDGVLDATTTQGTTYGSGVTRFGFLGTGSEANSYNGSRGPNSYFNGEMDELRVWSEARTALELQSTMNTCLIGTEPNLEIYYKSNNGPSSSTISDLVSNSNGNLINFNTTTAWKARTAEYSCPSCESTRASLTVTIDNSSPASITGDVFASCSPGNPVLDAGSGYSDYLWNTGATSQTIVANTSGDYIVTVSNAGCYDSDTVSVNLEGGHAESMGSYDGSNDYSAINNTFYNSSSITELSVEAWIRTTDAGNQIIASFDRSEYWRLGINGDGAGSGRVAWNLRTSAGILDFGSTTRVDDGNWHLR